MAVPVTTLALRVRQELKDYGAGTFVLDGEHTAVATSINLTTTPADPVKVGQRAIINLEVVEVGTVADPMTVVRGIRGSTAAAQATGSLLIVEPRFTNQDILYGLIAAQRQLAGFVPKRAIDDTNTIATNVEEYEAPVGTFAIEMIEMEQSVAGLYRPWPLFEILDANDPPTVRILGSPPAGRTLRLTCMSQYTEFTWATTDASYEVPLRYHDFLVDWAKGELLLNEAGYKARVVGAASGQGASVQESLIYGQTLKASALNKLNTVRPASRVIQRPASNMYRMP